MFVSSYIVCMYVCVHTHIYIYIYTHTYNNTYIIYTIGPAPATSRRRAWPLAGLRILPYLHSLLLLLLLLLLLSLFKLSIIITYYCTSTIRSISEFSSCFVLPRPWHIEIRHRVKQKRPQLICSDLRLSNWNFED